MRTLKRSICLVLSLVMLLGVCTVFVSADDAKSNLDKYADKNDIQYEEAVDVLTGIGVLQGDAAGFRPKDNINRAEAAKIISYLLIGNAQAADALKASVKTFADVEKDWWAAGYIAYCAERGIVNGKGNNMYDPLANVTGVEFVKMLLCAIGYGVNDEYVGPAWAINVAKDGVQYGIFNGNLKGASEEPATREECALYAFNTLLKRKVTYSSLFGGYIEDVVYNAESNKEPTIAEDYRLENTKIESRKDYWDKKINSIDSDAFYRPNGYYWYQRYTNHPVSGTYNKSYLLETYYDSVHANDIYNLLGADVVNRLIGTDAFGGDYSRIRFRVYENGLEYEKNAESTPNIQLTNGNLREGYSWIELVDTANGGLQTFRRSNQNILAHTGKGVVTEVYGITSDDGELVEVRIVLTHTYLAKITTVTNATTTTDRTVTVQFPTVTDDKGIENRGLVSYHRGQYYDNGVLKYAPLEFDNPVFETNKFSRNDYVLVNYSFRGDGDFTPGIKYMNDATVVSGRITQYANRTNTVAISNVTYSIALDDMMVDNGQTRAQNITSEFVDKNYYTIFMDERNNVIGVNGQPSTNKFVYVAQFGFKLNNGNELTDKWLLTAEVYEANGNGQAAKRTIYNVDTEKSRLSGLAVYESSSSSSVIRDLNTEWNAREMEQGEKDLVRYLNTNDYGVITYDNSYLNQNWYSVGLYHMSVNSNGSIVLVNPETYAASQDAALSQKNNKTKEIQVVAVGQNVSGDATGFKGSRIIKGDKVLRDVEYYKDATRYGTYDDDNDPTTPETVDYGVSNTNYRTGYQYNLTADSNTLFYYVNGEYGAKNFSVVAYTGIAHAPSTNNKDDSSKVYSWYAEDPCNMTVTPATTTGNALAQAVLVTGTKNVTKPSSDAVYVYLDNKDKDALVEGSYVKESLEDERYSVDFTVYKVTENFKEVTLHYEYDNEPAAEAAINKAATLVNNFVVENSDHNGLERYVVSDQIKESKEDKATYVGVSTIESVEGSTVRVSATILDDENVPRNVSFEVEDEDVIRDARMVGNSEKITSLTQIQNVLAGKEPNGRNLVGNKKAIRALVAYSEDEGNKAVCLYIIGFGDVVTVDISKDGDAEDGVIVSGADRTLLPAFDVESDWYAVKVTSTQEANSGKKVNASITVYPNCKVYSENGEEISKPVKIDEGKSVYFCFVPTDKDVTVTVHAEFIP